LITIYNLFNTDKLAYAILKQYQPQLLNKPFVTLGNPERLAPVGKSNQFTKRRLDTAKKQCE